MGTPQLEDNLKRQLLVARAFKKDPSREVVVFQTDVKTPSNAANTDKEGSGLLLAGQGINPDILGGIKAMHDYNVAHGIKSHGSATGPGAYLSADDPFRFLRPTTGSGLQLAGYNHHRQHMLNHQPNEHNKNDMMHGFHTGVMHSMGMIPAEHIQWMIPMHGKGWLDSVKKGINSAAKFVDYARKIAPNQVAAVENLINNKIGQVLEKVGVTNTDKNHARGIIDYARKHTGGGFAPKGFYDKAWDEDEPPKEPKKTHKVLRAYPNLENPRARPIYYEDEVEGEGKKRYR